jgi:hypothetical protein
MRERRERKEAGTAKLEAGEFLERTVFVPCKDLRRSAENPALESCEGGFLRSCGK